MYMAIEILMPALSPTMKQGTLATWVKKEGDKVVPGEVMAEIETDKALMEVEAVEEGTIAKIIIPSGTKNVPVNAVIALLTEEDESVEEVINSLNTKKESTAAETKNLYETELSGAGKPDSDKRIFVSPVAKRLALHLNLNLNNITGSGPRGRIVKADVEKIQKVSTETLPRTRNDTFVEISNMRQTIADRLTHAKQQVPHFYLEVSCKIDKLLEFRTHINSLATRENDGNPVYKVSINDLIIRAVGLSLEKHPDVNSAWLGNKIVRFGNVNIAVAVTIEEGLITPIIENANEKDILTISSEMKKLAKFAKEKKLQPDQYQGGGFTISNLGMFGIKNFYPIINTPQSCIMGVGSAEKMVGIDAAGQFCCEHTMSISLACDHRTVDGVICASFLKSFKEFLEKPLLMTKF
jgi:pyruvate dehydrogenase E2 component (dihydrolipoamide acetyltransferase)